MQTALIGFTGFVGSNLLKQYDFDALYNSKNIQAITHKKFDLVVCAGTPAVKWLANKEPEQDWQSIATLISNLNTISANRFVLISTVDVYPNPVDVTETTPIDPSQDSPYGKHRFLLEQFAQRTFAHTHIIRLPALFGQGIKKNVIFDMIYNNELEKINPKSQFQFYNLAYLWRDIATTIAHKIALLNMATEPITVAEIYQTTFQKPFPFTLQTQPAQYAMKSLYAAKFGGHTGYLYQKPAVLTEIKNFILTERKKL